MADVAVVTDSTCYLPAALVDSRDVAEDAQMLVDRLVEMFGTEPEFVSEVGPVIATHVGPGALLAGGLPEAALGGGRG